MTVGSRYVFTHVERLSHSYVYYRIDAYNLNCAHVDMHCFYGTIIVIVTKHNVISTNACIVEFKPHVLCIFGKNTYTLGT